MYYFDLASAHSCVMGGYDYIHSNHYYFIVCISSFWQLKPSMIIPGHGLGLRARMQQYLATHPITEQTNYYYKNIASYY